MSTYTFSPDFNDIAEQAFDVLQIGSDGETLTARMLAGAQNAYNYMITHWQTQGLHLWTYTEGRMYLTKSQRSYDTSAASTLATFARITNAPIDDSLGAAAALGASTVTVADGTKFSASDTIGVLQDDSTIHWTTINGAPAGNVITLTAVTTAAASSGNYVTAYNDTYAPISRIHNEGFRRYSGTSNIEVPILRQDRPTYYSLSDKFTATGTPVNIYFSRSETSLGQGHKFEVYQAPDSEQYALNFTYERQLQVIDTPTTDKLDCPRYWHEAIVWNLADRLKIRFGVKSAEVSAEIRANAAEFLTDSLNYDTSPTDIRVVP